MLICDRCESKKAVSNIQSLTAKIGNQAVSIYDKSVDLCDVCVIGLKKEVAKYLEPLAKSK